MLSTWLVYFLVGWCTVRSHSLSIHSVNLIECTTNKRLILQPTSPKKPIDTRERLKILRQSTFADARRLLPLTAVAEDIILCETETEFHRFNSFQNVTSSGLQQNPFVSYLACNSTRPQPSLTVIAGQGVSIISVSSGITIGEECFFPKTSYSAIISSTQVSTAKHETTKSISSSSSTLEESSNSHGIMTRSDLIGTFKTPPSLSKSHVRRRRKSSTESVLAGEQEDKALRIASSSTSAKSSTKVRIADQNQEFKEKRIKKTKTSVWKSTIQSTVLDVIRGSRRYQSTKIDEDNRKKISELEKINNTSVNKSNNTKQTIDFLSNAVIHNIIPHEHHLTQPSRPTCMGILGEAVPISFPKILPYPGTVLAKSTLKSSDIKCPINVRTSVPNSFDDSHIANLRLSVFSKFDKERQQLFRSRSIEVLNSRRGRGAVALVAEISLDGSQNNTYSSDFDTKITNGHFTSSSSWVAQTVSKNFDNKENAIIGTAECSHQEFRNTMLGNSRPEDSLMYVTEVAVCPGARRLGAGTMLMEGVDKVAALRNVESIYLHVDVTNVAAHVMYEKAGYHKLDLSEPIYAQFSASLNLHDEATHGRKHHLLCKNRTANTTCFKKCSSLSEESLEDVKSLVDFVI